MSGEQIDHSQIRISTLHHNFIIEDNPNHLQEFCDADVSDGLEATNRI